MEREAIRLGISRCLLGDSVRYDGSHKLDRYLRDELGRYVEYVPVCPEVECGYPIPRPSFRLIGDPSCPRLVTPGDGVDHTDRMVAWARERVEQLAGENLCGFVFKSKSPSSGMERVKVYDGNNVPRNAGVGVFARVFMERFPLLPVEEEGRLHDPALRENFIERIFALKRWRDTLAGGCSGSHLVEFHTRHKLLIMSHSVEHYREMGRLVADAGAMPAEDLCRRYEESLLTALKREATRRKHANVLYHIMGYFKKLLDADEKAELGELIEGYRTGIHTLVIPMTLLNHYVRKYDVEYLAKQVYLNPHPIELQLRNHV